MEPRTPHAAHAIVAVALMLSAGFAGLAGALPPLPQPQAPSSGSGPLGVWASSLAPGEGNAVAAWLLGGAVVAGTERATGVVAAANAAGTTMWTARTPGADWRGVAALPDGSTVVTGLQRGPSGDADVVTMQFDAQGTPQWSRTLRTPEDDAGHAVAGDAKAVYVVGTSGIDALIIKYAPDGTPQWTRKLASGIEEHADSVALASDGGALVVGWSYDGVRNKLRLWHLDPQGVVLWGRSVPWSGGSLRGEAIATDLQGDLLVGGSVASGRSTWPVAAKFDPRGTQLWQHVLVGEPHGEGTGIVSTLDGGAVLGGLRDTGEGFLARLAATGTLLSDDPSTPGTAPPPAGLARDNLGIVVGGTRSGNLAAARLLDLPVQPG